GPIYATRTKENPDPVQGLDGLRAAVEAADDRPIVAIGGINADRAADVFAAGAAAVCAIAAINDATDATAAIGALRAARRSPQLETHGGIPRGIPTSKEPSMAKLGVFASLTAIICALGIAMSSSTSMADDPKPCVRKDFKTDMVKNACSKGGQDAA